MRIKFIVHMVSIVAILTFAVPVKAQQQALELKPVVVTATRQEEEILRIPAHITIISKEDIENSNASDIGDLLRTESGFMVTNSSGSTPTGIVIDGRGFNNGGGNGSRVLVLIDGRRANLVDSSNPDWALVPIESIERIEIVRGSSTSLYGDNAISGVINIITKKGAEEPSLNLSADWRFYDCWNGRTGLDRVDFDCWNRGTSLSGAKGALSYYLMGSYQSKDGFRENSQYKASNYIGNFDYKISPFSKFHLGARYLSNEGFLPGLLTESQIATLGREFSTADGDRAKAHHAQFDLAFDSSLTKNHWIELTIGQTNRDAGFIFPGFEGKTDSRSRNLTGKSRVTKMIAGRENRTVIGVDFIDEKVDSEDTFNISNYKRKLIGGYAHHELSVSPSLILTESLRYDRAVFDFTRKTTGETFDRSFGLWSPRIGMTYLLSSSISLFGNWSKSFRFPNQNELVGFTASSPKLDPEQATSYEVGTKIQSGRVFEGTASLFKMNVEDEILLNPLSFENQNFPQVEHKGIEVSSLIHIGDSLRLKGNYALTKTKIKKGTFKGSELPITPRHSGSAAIFMGNGSGWVLSITGRFLGERFLANDLSNIEEKSPKYAVYDTKLQYIGETYDFFIGANNILNREYAEFDIVGGVYPSPGRNGVAGIKAHF